MSEIDLTLNQLNGLREIAQPFLSQHYQLLCLIQVSFPSAIFPLSNVYALNAASLANATFAVTPTPAVLQMRRKRNRLLRLLHDKTLKIAAIPPREGTGVQPGPKAPTMASLYTRGDE
jgi:hypothetical protein